MILYTHCTLYTHYTLIKYTTLYIHTVHSHTHTVYTL
uniref:Uncharacterized protein n=1 Tax=Anguilla anguilla TaxID=7936 RepID=A0A0E9R4N6_ANGAN